MRRSNVEETERGSVRPRRVFAAAMLAAVALLAASCSTDTIGPIPMGADESASALAADAAPDTDTDTEAEAADDEAGLASDDAPSELAFVNEAEDAETDAAADGPAAADDPGDSDVNYDAPADRVDAIGVPANPVPLDAPELSDRFLGDGETLVAEDGSLLVTCGSAGIDVESDGRPIDGVAVSSDGEVSTFLDIATSEVSVSGSIQTVWVDLEGVEQRFDC